METKIILIYIVIWFIVSFFMAYPALDLQEKKGYDGSFILAFLFGVFYLIYSAGLPLKKDDYTLNIKNTKKTNEECIDKTKKEFRCKKCGFPVYPDEDKCSYCKEPNLNHKKKN